MWWNVTAFRPTYPDLVDSLFTSSDAPPPAIVVLVDAFTAYGGSQFLNSPGTGRYLDYLCDDVVGYVDTTSAPERSRLPAAWPVNPVAAYGAMVVPMLRPDVFGALASHAGDALFELCYLPEFPVVVRALRDDYDGSYEAFWADFRSRVAWTPTERRAARQHLLHGRLLLRRAGWIGDAAVRPADRDVCATTCGLAGSRSIPSGWRTIARRRCDRCAASTSTRVARTSTSWTWSAGLRCRTGHGRLCRTSSTSSTPGTGAIEWRYPLALRYLAECLAT